MQARTCNGVVAIAEEYVSKDQHRADLLELYGELKEEIAGSRQEVVPGVGPALTVLSKNVEHLTQTGETALGQLISAITERMNASDEPHVKAVAYDLSR